MADEQQLKDKFWKALQSDMTMMLGLSGVNESHTRPMTAQLDGEHGPIWFFSSTESELVKEIDASSRAVATFVSKGHDVFAAVHGNLAIDSDRAVIDRLWNAHIAAWYEGGRDDPKLVLLRLNAERAEIWKDGSSLWAGVTTLLGMDPKKDYKSNVADVDLK